MRVRNKKPKRKNFDVVLIALQSEATNAKVRGLMTARLPAEIKQEVLAQ